MLKNLKTWFEQATAIEQESPLHTVELATAVLFFEIIRADDKFEKVELEKFRQLLESHFSLLSSEIEELVQLATEQAKKSVDFHQFTRVINDSYDAQQKNEVVESLWKLAYADGAIDGHEEHLIRKIADLLYLPHSQFIKAKLKAEDSET